ncbi:trigger factor [Sulfurospirillum sp. T05]|uniref:Trigger factor n=1 Tax=Sulfurospirillum tamanense TaxID=2813362 RepID=A0ABS2WTK5_9BACT|nr:trigger factor [Sulfurospirillum tamanensis]MBN2964925.1 trigger factor [Sulfurospirillum tamanensis]
MEVTAKMTDGANATASAKISQEDLAKKQEKIAKSVAKDAKVDGFRAGKVPMAVIMKRFGDKIKQDAEQEALQALLDEGVKAVGKETKNIVGEPQVSKFDRTDAGLDVEVKISFRPEVSVEGYEACIPEYATPKVTKKEIGERMEKLLEMAAPLQKIEEDRALQTGDTALFDFEGFIDGEPFEGGKAEKYLLDIGSNQFIPGFEEGMVGLKAGEERDVKVNFPEEYGAKHLAGKEAIFKVKLHEIQGKVIAKTPDEETLKRLLPGEENATAELLEQRIKEQIKNEKVSKLMNDELKPKFIDAVVEKLTFDLPENIVEQEIDMQFRNQWQNFTEEETEEFRANPDKVQEKRETFREEAVKSVKLTFIVDELAKVNEITVADQEVLQTLYYEAMQQGQDPKQYVEMYKNQGVLPAVKMALIEDKLFTKLFDKESKAK